VLDTQELLNRLFSPRYFEVLGGLDLRHQRLVHYTSAENGLKIINGREVWMRHASVMNDFSEMEHGARCLATAWHSERGKRFQGWLDQLVDGLSKRLAASFDRDQPSIKNDTYLTSVSLHETGMEDLYGRLSMWRAYGGKSGVALVMHPTAFQSETDLLGAYSYPVTYQDAAQFMAWFEVWADVLAVHTDQLKVVADELLAWHLNHAFRMFVLCTKHPGFHEEKEWRVFHTPLFDGGDGKAVRKSFETINGIPQPVFKIPLDPTLGVPGLGLSELLDRVIIGPTQHATPIALAYAEALTRVGIEDPSKLIIISDLPLRH
jgi:hypothetical protein